MNFKRITILNLFLAIGLGSVLLLPKSYGIRDSAVIATFPSRVGDWIGETVETPELVVNTLAKDTGHRRSIYSRIIRNEDGEREQQQIAAFMVIGGADMNSSIHRPERCFPAQGLAIQKNEYFQLTIDEETSLPVTMLDAEAVVGGDGPHKGKTYRQRAYYWFVGHTDTTNSHWERTLIDMKDRVFRGYNQRWAYIMLSIHYGLEGAPGPTGKEVGKLVENLIRELYSDLHKTDQMD